MQSWLFEMDPSIFLQYSPPNGLPQESKLATYMNRTTSTPTRSLSQALGKLSLESSPTAIKKVLMGEFVPVNYFTSPGNILPDSPESSPPSTLAAVPQNTPQVHQENVGGTTYFYATNSDGLNTSGGHNSSASIAGSEMSQMSSGPLQHAGAVTPSPYASQIYQGTPTHIGPGPAKSAIVFLLPTLSFVNKPMLMALRPSHYAQRSAAGLAASFYMPETIRSEIYQRNEDVFLQTDLRQYPDLPENIEMYSELIPIESPAPHSMATSFRATHRQSGDHYAVRRLHGYTSVPTKRLEQWAQIDHPNIVKLHDYYTTKAFGDHSMVLVYEYHSGCSTLMSKFLSFGGGGPVAEGNNFHDPFSNDPDAPRPYTHQKNAMLRAVACGALLPEAVLWSLLVQLTAALRAIHSAGLACRNLDPTKVVMNGCRVRIAWPGAADALLSNGNDVAQAQQEDLTALGRLALALACRTIHWHNMPASMEIVARTYSADLKNLILYLITTTPARRSVTDLMPMIGARFYTQVEALERRADAFETQLAREIDNGRLLRILIKLGVVNERPELNMDASWSETGDRYMLKLFRDHLFHGVAADGRPWLDQAHLTHALNRLDTGSNDKVELMSRDEQSVLVVSYAELKHSLEQAFDEVMQAAAPPP